MELLKDRVAMITGGTGALGRAVGEHFLANGAKVAVPWIVEPEVLRRIEVPFDIRLNHILAKPCIVLMNGRNSGRAWPRPQPAPCASTLISRPTASLRLKIADELCSVLHTGILCL